MIRKFKSTNRRLPALVLFAAALALPVGTFAEDSVFTAAIDNIHQTTLDNGLEVVVIEDHSLPVVAIEIANAVVPAAFHEQRERAFDARLPDHRHAPQKQVAGVL